MRNSPMNLTNSVVKNFVEADVHCIEQRPLNSASREGALSDLGAKNSLKKKSLGYLILAFRGCELTRFLSFWNEYLESSIRGPTVSCMSSLCAFF